MTYSTVAAHGASAPLQGTRRWTRRILSVVSGVVTIMVLSSATDIVLDSTGVLPSGALYDTGLLLLATTYRVAYSVLASCIVARFAPDHPMRHALAFGGVGVVMSTIGVIVNAHMHLGAMWYTVLLVVVAMPCAWCGGKLFEVTATVSTDVVVRGSSQAGSGH
jgi:hypothetical protein